MLNVPINNRYSSRYSLGLEDTCYNDTHPFDRVPWDLYNSKFFVANNPCLCDVIIVHIQC